MVRLKVIPQLWDSSSTSVLVPQKEVCHEPKDPDKHDGDIEQVCQIILVSNHLTYTTSILFFMGIFIVAEVDHLCDANKTNSLEILRWKTTFITGATATFPRCASTSVRMGVQNSQEQSFLGRQAAVSSCWSSYVKPTEVGWHRQSSGKWRHKLRRIDNTTDALRNAVSAVFLSPLDVNCGPRSSCNTNQNLVTVFCNDLW